MRIPGCHSAGLEVARAHLEMECELVIDVPCDVPPQEAAVAPPGGFGSLTSHVAASALGKARRRAQHLRDGASILEPAGRFALEVTSSGSRELVVACAAVVLGQPPLRRDQAAV